jgi:hypothetical protein
VEKDRTRLRTVLRACTAPPESLQASAQQSTRQTTRASSRESIVATDTPHDGMVSGASEAIRFPDKSMRLVTGTSKGFTLSCPLSKGSYPLSA